MKIRTLAEADAAVWSSGGEFTAYWMGRPLAVMNAYAEAVLLLDSIIEFERRTNRHYDVRRHTYIGKTIFPHVGSGRPDRVAAPQNMEAR